MSQRRTGMGLLVLGMAVAMTGALAGIRAATLYGCGGTPIVVCSRTAYLAKFVSGNVVNPGTGNPVNVPIGLVPYVAWNQASGAGGFLCAQPRSAEINLNITCRPVGGGNAVTVPTITIAMMPPSSSGIQSSPGGGSGPTNVTIPAGLLATGVQYQCTVVGTYDVGFGGASAGSGSIRGRGDTEFCIVDPAPSKSSEPRLDVRAIDIGDGMYTIALRGDQVLQHYLIANNDLNESVVLTATAGSNQISRLPDVVPGGSPDVHALSLPTANTDHFPNTFSGGVDPGGLVPLPDPSRQGAQQVDGAVFLGPGEMTIVSIATRSHGMCADGSCSDAVFGVMGNWVGSGDVAIGCAGTTTIVDESAPERSPLCEMRDSISVSSGLRAVYSPAVFDGEDVLSTHHAGNVLTQTISFGGGGGTQLIGSGFGSANNVEGFPNFANDSLRLHHVPQMVEYQAQIFTDLGGTPRHTMDVTIKNLNGQSSSIPFFRSESGNSRFKVIHDRTKETLVIKEGSRTRYSGDFNRFFSNMPKGITYEQGTSRSFSKTGAPSRAFPAVLPPAAAVNDGMTFPNLIVVNGNSPNGIGSGSATASLFSGNSLSVGSSVMFGSPLMGSVLSSSIPSAPNPPQIHLLRVFASGSSRGTVVPIAVRNALSTPKTNMPFDVDALTINVDFAKPGKARDKFQLKFRFPLGNPTKGFAGEGFTIQFGGFSETFTLDKKGKGKVQKLKNGKKDQKGTIAVKNKKGVGKATFTISKADLAGHLADEGLLNKSLQSTGSGRVKIKFIFCGETFETVAKITIKSKEGKKAKAKLDKTL